MSKMENLKDSIKEIREEQPSEKEVSSLLEILNETDNEQVIKKFLNKIAQQDNRCTAAPYFYVIRTKVKRPAYDGCGEVVEYYDPEDPECTFDSVEDYIQKRKEWSGYDEMLDIEKEEFDEKMESAEYDLEKIESSYEWEEKGMFLTEDDAKSHLKSNHYHYSEDAHTYVKHSWRAPELTKFFRALYAHFEIEKGNLDL